MPGIRGCMATKRKIFLKGTNQSALNLDNMLEAFFTGAAIAGIYIIWQEFTAKAFENAYQIIFPSSEEETCESVTKVMCEECREVFSDDEYDEDELVNGKLLCESCRDDIIRGYLEK